MTYFLGMEILTGIVDGKLKFCVIEEAASGVSSEGKHVSFETLEDAKAYIKIKSGRVVTVRDDFALMVGLKDFVGVTGSGALRVLESPQTANLKNPHRKQGCNDAFSIGGLKRS